MSLSLYKEPCKHTFSSYEHLDLGVALPALFVIRGLMFRTAKFGGPGKACLKHAGQKILDRHASVSIGGEVDGFF